VKIFVIGAEGSGKTIFLAMLSRYLHQNHDKIVLEPADFKTSQYVVEVQHTLAQGQWPESTRIGQSIVLKWTFQLAGHSKHDLTMYDSAGQDLRMLMLTEDLEDLSAQDKAALAAAKSSPDSHLGSLRDQIHSADALVYLLDLESLLETSDARVQNEHCWLLKAFLSHPKWKNKKRIVLLTKKDKYGALLQESRGDVRECIRKHLPEFYSVGHHLDHRDVEFAAISSVATETMIDDSGSAAPVRNPSRMFAPGDMAGITAFLERVAASPVQRVIQSEAGEISGGAKAVAKRSSGCGLLLAAVGACCFGLVMLGAIFGEVKEKITPAPVNHSFQSAWTPGGGYILVLENTSNTPISNYVLRIDSTNGKVFGPYRMGELPASQTTKLGWMELNNWVLNSGDRIRLSIAGYADKTIVVP